MSEFSNYCEDEIAKHLINIYNNIEWEPRCNFFKSSSYIDILGLSRKNIYIIELELRREDPVNNVVKVFRVIDENTSFMIDKRLYFIHVFSDFYKTHKSKRYNSVFVGEKMSKAFDNLEYFALDFNLLPPKKGDSFPKNTSSSIKTLCDDIVSLIKS